VKSFAYRFPKLFLLAICACTLALAQRTKYVLIVVIDGARYTETFGDSVHANIPCIWDQLRPLGTIYTSLYNDGVAKTNSGHASILTGTRQALRNNGTELPHSPTVFEYFRKQKNADANKCWVALGKSKLAMLAYSDHTEYGSKYTASVRTSASQYDDSIAWHNARSVLTAHHPNLMIVNFPATDESGHSCNWSTYVGAIHRADTLAASLWEVIQSDSLLRDKTTMIITNDHGRHTNDFSGDGDGCEGCRHVMLLVLGPDTPAGGIDTSARKLVDIALTVGKLLGFNTPYATGSVLESVITGKQEIPRQ
jgi:hypothetical protein